MTCAQSNERRYVLNPFAHVVRVGPRHIMLILGSISGAIAEITCETEDICDKIEARLKSSVKDPLNEAELEELLPQYKDSLINLGLLVPEDFSKLHLATGKAREQSMPVIITHAGDKLAEILSEFLVDLGINIKALRVEDLSKTADLGDKVLIVAAFDYWRPDLLRELNRWVLLSNRSLLPVFLLPDGAIVGPLISRGYPCYLCFERQLLASLARYLALRILRDEVITQSTQGDTALRNRTSVYPLAYLNFAASLAAILIAHVVIGNDHVLKAKAVVIDFCRLYIDVIRVHKVPTCICVNVCPRAEL